MWLSLVEHVLREHGVGGSNPLIPTSNSKGLRIFRSPFFLVRPAWAHFRGCKSHRKLITANEAKRNCGIDLTRL